MELMQLDLPYSAVILAAVLYDADRYEERKITVRQRDIAKTMHASVNTIYSGIRSLEQAGIILSHRSLGDATEIVLKEGVLPPRQKSGGRKDRQPSDSSLDMDEAELLMNALHT